MCSLSFETQPLYHFKKQQSWGIASDRLTSCACLEKESALAIMAAVLSSSSPSFCPLSSRAILARANSPTTPDAAPFMPSIPPGPGMCCARLREALPADTSPTAGENKQEGYDSVPANIFQESANSKRNLVSSLVIAEI